MPKLNIHYLTYPLLVIAAVAAIYLSGKYHQKQVDHAQVMADSANAKAAAVAKAKAHADSLANDSIAKLQNKVTQSKKATTNLEKQNDSLAKAVETAKDTAQLVTALKVEVVHSDSIIESQAYTIVDQANQIVFMASKILRDSLDYQSLAALNNDTNAKLAKANAAAHPGIVKRIVSNLDLLAIEGVACHVAHC